MRLLLGIPHEVVEVDTIRGETRKPPFLAKNPNGRFPLLELEDGTFLPESNAILFYLAEGSRYLPDERLARARALQWLFFEQYSHEPYIAVLRFWSRHTDKAPETEPQWRDREKRGYDALGVMEKSLAGQRSEEHTSELQSLMRISYAVFCLTKKKTQPHI